MAKPSKMFRIRTQRGLTQEKAAELGGTTSSQVAKLEGGKRKVTPHWATIFARVYDCDPADLIDAANVGQTIPARYAVFSAFTEGVDAPPVSTPPLLRIAAPPGLDDPENCVAARVLDDSCDRLYPPTSTLIVRQLETAGPLRIGQKILVQRRLDADRPDVMEVLAGVLDRSSTGDLLLTLRTTNRALPGSIVIQAAPQAGLRDRTHVYSASPSPQVDYTPRADDANVIVGPVVMAITPE